MPRALHRLLHANHTIPSALDVRRRAPTDSVSYPRTRLVLSQHLFYQCVAVVTIRVKGISQEPSYPSLPFHHHWPFD